MKFILKETYLSLAPFESDDLAPLAIITGINGSGKTQLLNIMSNIKNGKPLEKKVQFSFEPRVTKIQYEGLPTGNSQQISYEHWRALIRQHFDTFNKLTLTERTILDFVIANDFVNNRNNVDGEKQQEYNKLLLEVGSNTQERIPQPHRSNLQILDQYVSQRITHNVNLKAMQLAKEICRDTGKNLEDLREIDFYNSSATDQIVDQDDLFLSKFEMVFYNYALRRDKNRKNYFYQQEDGENNNAVSDDDFLKTNKAPWDIINEILEKHCVDFYFKGIDKKEFSIDVPVEFKLYKKSTGTAVQFADLSDGEKMIIGLVLKLFTSTHYGENLSFPELILLDEPDAHLHPEMSKLLLDVLKNTFVNKLGIKVLLTTHSPSTIALAPEESIYRLTNGNPTSLTKTSKDEALQLLTGFIPTLSIDYKNHRQVFVESPTDVSYYQTIHDKYQQEKRLRHKLYFISNAPGKGNCQQVYEIVEKIRKSGNTTSWGIVDWDTKNTNRDNVFVHGLDERYSVENFILDPIYIFCLLVELNNAHGICQKIGISVADNQYLLGEETDTRLEEIVKVFFSEFAAKFPAYRYAELEEVDYLNGKKIFFPKWYLAMNGHEIVEKVKQIFPALNKYTSEGELQISLIRIIGKCYPFVPRTTIHVIEKIA